jgi:hypothetical protein
MRLPHWIVIATCFLGLAAHAGEKPAPHPLAKHIERRDAAYAAYMDVVREHGKVSEAHTAAAREWKAALEARGNWASVSKGKRLTEAERRLDEAFAAIRESSRRVSEKSEIYDAAQAELEALRKALAAAEGSHLSYDDRSAAERIVSSLQALGGSADTPGCGF